MQYINYYDSPLGKIILTADEIGLCELKFIKQKEIKAVERKNLKIFDETKRWLDIYFKGKKPDFTPKINQSGSNFRLNVWNILKQIPYGKTLTYKDIAKQIALQKEIKKMSAQAVGGAIAHNKILIIIPCHRVIGSNGSLTGYAGGIENKIKLLELEGVDLKSLML